jgi:glutathionyl-hydroquinone reductase
VRFSSKNSPSYVPIVYDEKEETLIKDPNNHIIWHSSAMFEDMITNLAIDNIKKFLQPDICECGNLD